MKRFNPVFVAAVLLVATMTLTMIRPSIALQAFAIVNCASTSTCTGGTNTSTGSGVQGISSLGKGVVGQTKFNSTTSANGQAGVQGQDLSTSGLFDAGVKGTSVRGVGVLGTSSSNAGVSGTSTSGTGVRGTSSSTSGVVGTTTSGVQAILGQAVSTTGVKGTSTNASASGNGVQAIASGFGAGVFATSGSGSGVSAIGSHAQGVVGNGNAGIEGQDFAGINAAANRDVVFANGFGGRLFRGNNSSGQDVFVVNNSGFTTVQQISAGTSTTFTGSSGFGTGVGLQGATSATVFPFSGIQGNNTGSASSIAIRANGFGGREFVGNGSSGVDNFIVDNSGNVFAHSFNATLAATQATANGGTISTYSSEARTPTIEDFGEATLVGGQVYVRLDPGFAGALARGMPYYVFITPMGPTHGLYVSARTASGFYVREMLPAGARVTFDYRIVGRRALASVPQVVVTRSAPKVQIAAPTLMTHPKIRAGVPR